MSDVVMSDVIFNLGDVRTEIRGNDIYFCIADVGKCLDYANPRAWGKWIDEDEKLMVQIFTSGQGRSMLFILESALYRILTKCHLPKAKVFERWITREVLPSIRKTGSYSLTQSNWLEDPDKLLELVQDWHRTKKLCIEQQKQLEVAKPKLAYYDLVLQSTSLTPITTIAKDYGYSAVSFNKLLHDYGVQYKLGGVWYLYDKYAKDGYVGTKTVEYTDSYGRTCTRVQTQWTQKGRLFLYNLLKDHDILPIMEKSFGSSENLMLN